MRNMLFMKRVCPVITRADSQKLNPFHTNKALRSCLFVVSAPLLTLFFAVSAGATVTTLSFRNGNDIAFCLDPDCHFFDDGIKFTMNLAPVPEMTAFYPIIGLLAAVTLTEVLRRRRLEQ